MSLSSGLERVREAARRNSSTRLTALFHHLTTELLEEAFHVLNPKAAAGVDEETWSEYAAEEDRRIRDLHQRLKRNAYRAKPSKRIYLSKPDGGKRPIGIAALEDKIVQQAVRWLLESIYEEDFLGFSYGFRPGRHPHKALDAVYVAITQRRVSWVLDADIRSFFDTLDHAWLMKFLEHRIGDPRILNLIEKWLRAGVSEDGEWLQTAAGTPQGAVISPILANIYLHYVFDLWVEQWRGRHARGEVYVVRYADDVLVMFQFESDARRFREELQERMQKFGLALHPEKTRLIEFGRFAASNRRQRGEGKPETFDYLGFTHICGTRRSDSRFALHRKTVGKRLRAKLSAIRDWLRSAMHAPVPDQGAHLRSVLQGYLRYFAVPGNTPVLSGMVYWVRQAWFRTLRRRSQKGRRLTAERFSQVAARWLPSVRVLHPYPNLRFRV